MQNPITKLYHLTSQTYSHLPRSYWYAITLNPKGKQVTEEETHTFFRQVQYKPNLLYALVILETSPKNHLHGIIYSKTPLNQKNFKIENITVHLKRLTNIKGWEKYILKHTPKILYEYNPLYKPHFYYYYRNLIDAKYYQFSPITNYIEISIGPVGP